MRAGYRSGALFVVLGVALVGCSASSESEKGGAGAIPSVGANEAVVEVPEMT